MSLADTTELSLLALIFKNTDFTTVGDAGGLRGSVTAGSIYATLHSADPGETGTATTSEATWTNYARVAVARSAAGWTTANTAPTQASNTAATTFPTGGATGQTVTHFSSTIGTTGSGAANILWSGALTASLAVSSGVTPSFAIGAFVNNLD